MFSSIIIFSPLFFLTPSCKIPAFLISCGSQIKQSLYLGLCKHIWSHQLRFHYDDSTFHRNERVSLPHLFKEEWQTRTGLLIKKGLFFPSASPQHRHTDKTVHTHTHTHTHQVCLSGCLPPPPPPPIAFSAKGPLHL
jgi:hypothetical protein